jgi:hypothetical protein
LCREKGGREKVGKRGRGEKRVSDEEARDEQGQYKELREGKWGEGNAPLPPKV